MDVGEAEGVVERVGVTVVGVYQGITDSKNFYDLNEITK